MNAIFVFRLCWHIFGNLFPGPLGSKHLVWHLVAKRSWQPSSARQPITSFICRLLNFVWFGCLGEKCVNTVEKCVILHNITSKGCDIKHCEGNCLSGCCERSALQMVCSDVVLESDSVYSSRTRVHIFKDSDSDSSHQDSDSDSDGALRQYA